MGETISMWNQLWLKVMWDALVVGNLFRPNTKEWIEKFIWYVFNVETAN